MAKNQKWVEAGRKAHATRLKNKEKRRQAALKAWVTIRAKKKALVLPKGAEKIPLPVLVRRLAALKAWKTIRAKKQKRVKAAKKAVATMRRKGYSFVKMGKKAWKTRLAKRHAA